MEGLRLIRICSEDMVNRVWVLAKVGVGSDTSECGF